MPSISVNRSGASRATACRWAAAATSQSGSPAPSGTSAASQCASSIAVVQPTWGMPSEAMIRSSGRLLRLLDRGVEVLGALPAEPLEALEVLDRQPEEVAARFETSPVWSSCSSVFQPAPSMSIPPTKLPNSWLTRAGHAVFGQ